MFTIWCTKPFNMSYINRLRWNICTALWIRWYSMKLSALLNFEWEKNPQHYALSLFVYQFQNENINLCTQHKYVFNIQIDREQFTVRCAGARSEWIVRGALPFRAIILWLPRKILPLTTSMVMVVLVVVVAMGWTFLSLIKTQIRLCYTWIIQFWNLFNAWPQYHRSLRSKIEVHKHKFNQRQTDKHWTCPSTYMYPNRPTICDNTHTHECMCKLAFAWCEFLNRCHYRWMKQNKSTHTHSSKHWPNKRSFY